jgi:hypothetical protein
VRAGRYAVVLAAIVVVPVVTAVTAVTVTYVVDRKAKHEHLAYRAARGGAR